MNYITAGYRVFVDRASEFINNISTDVSDNNNQSIRKRIFLKVPMITQLKTFLSPPTYIVNNIYLGSAFNASNKELLDYYNIKYIINITNEISNHFPDDDILANLQSSLVKLVIELNNYVTIEHIDLSKLIDEPLLSELPVFQSTFEGFQKKQLDAYPPLLQLIVLLHYLRLGETTKKNHLKKQWLLLILLMLLIITLNFSSLPFTLIKA